ncbi:hypothetical protein JZO70_13545 [Enterococcus sp. 669A]|uniref:Uncharacterized protein n=1 Tax=Candidatus Enterococcus moelleringii TaxID=2815325 RepID=A0ABS3LC33_9ENTE|nr:hypothetical protein [Enterococcus sp. 669A]MBO1307196.1 hypothetical protein [Enterococcus sp. 669A]
MNIKYLELKQLLTLQPGSLKGRFKDNYNHKVKDAAYIIQAAVLVMVRNFFSIDNFSFMARDFIRELFLDHSAELVSVRHLCIYFEAYFTEEEWAGIIDSLFTDHDEYLQVTANARLHTEHILPMLHAGKCEVETPKNLALTFFDAAGKKHRCTIKNVHRSYTTQENCAALSILGMLTIFEKDGVRRFTKLAKSRFVTYEDDYDCANEEVPVEPQVKPWVINDLFQQEDAPGSASEMKADNQNVPKHYHAHDSLKGKTRDQLQDFLFEGVNIKKLSEHAKLSRTATAMLEGIPVKEAKAKFTPEENPGEILDQLLKDWEARLREKHTLKKETPEKKASQEARLEEIRRQRQEKQEKDKIDKALRRKGKGGGKKGKNGKRKK